MKNIKNSFLKLTFLLMFSLFMGQLMAQTLNSTTGHLNLRSQNIYGDNATAFYLKSNHSTAVQLILRDKENKNYGRLYGNGNGVNFGLQDGDGNWSYLAAKDSYTAFRINNNEKMRILTNGNVGIGRTNPTVKLEVNGSVRVGDNIWGALIIDGKNDNDWLLNSHVDGESFYFRTGASWANIVMAFKGSTGNVGIGTNNPGTYKLAVNGKIRAKEVVVESGWSDFVFEDDYNLPTLEEEKLHIKEKGHLIGFESEEAMGGEIKMGDVINRQQQKIEESVLHLIELEEKIQELEKENDLLKEENKQLMQLQLRIEALESKE